jgi:hypothetical protein
VKILLDECVHRKMKHALVEHEVKTVGDMHWQGILNGQLLSLAASEFDAFLTVDKNLQFQQNLHSLPLPVIAIHSLSLRWDDLEPFIANTRLLLQKDLQNEVYIIES